ncbi:hypothetical protein GH733_002587 [Mirounga leonina]|nr:hypothetical protein GH733_002587 [Mirounga leonina]
MAVGGHGYCLRCSSGPWACCLCQPQQAALISLLCWCGWWRQSLQLGLGALATLAHVQGALELLLGVHTAIGLPWWTCIGLTTVAQHCVVTCLPHDILAKVENLQPEKKKQKNIARHLNQEVANFSRGAIHTEAGISIQEPLSLLMGSCSFLTSLHHLGSAYLRWCHQFIKVEIFALQKIGIHMLHTLCGITVHDSTCCDSAFNDCLPLVMLQLHWPFIELTAVF